jgi:glycosyltransferase involved in cell wall biosynthesis
MGISIALCTYNGEKFLREQLDSIAGQTVLPEELVVCDDRSTDATLRILEDFSEQVSFPVHIHRNEVNLGSTKNFEKAICLCRGDVIALCDQDDVWKPNKLQRLVEELNNNPDAGYAFSNAEMVDEQLQPLGGLLWDSIKFTGEVRRKFYKGEQIECFIRQHIVTGATMAFRTQIGKVAMPFPTAGKWIHDGWIALVSSSTGARGVAIDEPLIDYRQHSSQQIGAPPPSEKNGDGPVKHKSLLDMYRELKQNEQILFQAWEYRGSKILLALPIAKNKLQELKDKQPSPDLLKNLTYMKRFETHFNNRRKILTTRDLDRYGLIFREALSGRYAQFSDSWRSIFRDIFL